METGPSPSSETLGKLHNYLQARFFPWNLLLEPVEAGALAHYVGVLSSSDLLHDPTLEAIQESLRLVAGDFQAEPESSEARARHGPHAPAYPFGFGQALVFASLGRAGRHLADLGDLPAVARVLGVSLEAARSREQTVERMLGQIRRRPQTARELVGRPLLDAGGSRLGRITDLLAEGDEVVEIRVQPERETPPAGLRRIGESVVFPAGEVRLRNPFSGTPRYPKQV